MIRPAALFVALAVPSMLPAQGLPAGAQAYQRCAACHLPNGAGVPGAFPPLRSDIAKFAATPAGRSYLVLVVTRGLSGPIVAEGKPYRGVMPAQAGMTDAQIAATLNHIVTILAKAGGAKPFTTAEVTRLKAAGATLKPADVARLNAQLTGR